MNHPERYPYCIVWTPIPLLTWIFPFVGHMGICKSNGIIYDFAGPYTITEDELSFGNTTRYIPLDVMKIGIPSKRNSKSFDDAIDMANGIYCGRMHNLFCDNCHSHVATALCDLEYMGHKNWNMVILAMWMFFFGRFVSFGRFLYTFLPFIILISIILAIRYSVVAPIPK